MDASMSELETLEDVAAQIGHRVTIGSRADHNTGRALGRWSVSPNIERASVAREKPQLVPAGPQSVAPAAKRAPAPKMPAVAPRVIEDYSQFVDAIRDRSNELGMTREELDHQAGHQSGYSGKLLSRKHIKRFGFSSLGPTLGALGLKILLIEDTAQTATIRARMKPRERPVRTQPLADGSGFVKPAATLPT
jgi:hypothetical protein